MKLDFASAALLLLGQEVEELALQVDLQRRSLVLAAKVLNSTEDAHPE